MFIFESRILASFQPSFVLLFSIFAPVTSHRSPVTLHAAAIMEFETPAGRSYTAREVTQ
jgi:hypothetical protein